MKLAPAMLKVLLFAFAASGITACAPTAQEALGTHIERAQSQGLPLLIYALGVPGEIAVAGNRTAVPVFLQFVVTSKQTIQSLQITLTGYTKRGTPVRARNGKIRAIVMTGPGPFLPGGNYEVNTFHSRPAGFPKGDVGCVEAVRLVIRYVGGGQKIYRARAINTLLLPPLRGGCKDQGPPVYSRSG